MSNATCTRYTYVKKLHNRGDCQGCREANAKYKRHKTGNYRSLAASQAKETGIACLASLNEELACGLPSTYEWFGCRGQACIKAAAKRHQDYQLIRF